MQPCRSAELKARSMTTAQSHLHQQQRHQAKSETMYVRVDRPLVES